MNEQFVWGTSVVQQRSHGLATLHVVLDGVQKRHESRMLPVTANQQHNMRGLPVAATV
jgi:hypothetical protein